LQVSALAASLCGCVIPADIEPPDESRPQFQIQLTVPNPSIVQTITQSGGSEVVVSRFNVAVVDPDSPTLRARAFIDGRYDAVLPDLVDQVVESNRGNLLEISGMCDEKVDFELGAHTLELYVSDGGFVDTGTDLRLPQPGGQRDNLLWRFVCVAPPLEGSEQ
jgi:hypothetical protein